MPTIVSAIRVSRIRTGAVLCLLFVSAVGGWPVLRAQHRPLQTDDPQVLDTGHVRFQVGFEFLQGQTFRLSGLEGDLTRIGVVGLFVGAGRQVEFQITGSLVNTLSIERQIEGFLSDLNLSGNSTSSVGDFTLATKFNVFRESDSRPALSFRFGVELPNAGNERGLGNDETNFHANLLLGKSFGRLRAYGNVGLAILGDPTQLSAQNDLLTYGLATTYSLNPRWSLVAEIHGRTGPGGPGTDDQSQIRLGTQFRTGALRWDLAGSAGFAAEDPDSGILFGLTYQFRGFRSP